MHERVHVRFSLHYGVPTRIVIPVNFDFIWGYFFGPHEENKQ